MADAEDVLAVAERAVEKALSRGADAAEAFALEERGASLGIERGVLSNGAAARDFGLGVRVVRDGRLSFAYAAAEDAVDAALDAAIRSAHVLRPAEGFEFAAAARAPDVGGIRDTRVADLSVEAAAEACDAMMTAARERSPELTITGGGVGWGEERVAVANSRGVRASYAATHLGAGLSVVLREGGDTTTGFAHRSSRRLDVDYAALGDEAGELAVASRRATAVSSGEMTVLFKPTALGGLLEFLFVEAARAESAATGRSVYAKRVGERVMPPEYSVADDGTLAGGLLSAPVDDEGVASRRTALVEGGVLRALLEDVAGARERGGEPTGSAVRAGRLSGSRSYRAPPRASGRNVVIEGPTRSFADLLRDVGDGIVVHDAMGAHTANPASGDFSVNASLVFRVEGGEIVGAAKPLMLSGNLPRALERLGGLADDYEDQSGSFSPVSMRIPTVRLDGVRVTAD